MNLIASIALMLSAVVGWGAQLRSHCISHQPSPQMVAAHDSHSANDVVATWTGPTGHQCDHCPPSECSRVAPCATQTSAALAAAVVPIVALLTDRADPSAEFDPRPLPPIQPPTPPPQPLS